MQLETLIGRAIAPRIPEVAETRIRHFREYPYLYEGSLAYEEAYLKGYLEEPRATLIRVLDGDRVAGIATATPLASSADVVADAPRLFAEAGYDPREFFYYAEIIVMPEYRGRGVARLVYAERERLARQWGYRRLCLAVVQRPAGHPLKPGSYEGPERIFRRDGFQETAIRFEYTWPTIQPDGAVVEQANPMRFWIRDL